MLNNALKTAPKESKEQREATDDMISHKITNKFKKSSRKNNLEIDTQTEENSIEIPIYIYASRVVMTEHTSSKNVSTTVFFNFFSFTQSPFYSNLYNIYI